MKRKLWLILGMVLVVAFTMIACNSDDTKSSAKVMKTFSISGATGIINETNKTIAVTLPYGTSVTALVATFTTTGSNVKVGSTVQTSGSTSNNFTSPVSYTVTAEDSSSVIYVVTVTVAGSPAKAIVTYSLGSYPGTVNETAKTIAVTVPYATPVTALVATFTTTGASVKVGTVVQASGTTANNFASPVTYTVTAADATTQTYIATVTIASGGTWTAMTVFGGSAREEAVAFAIGTKGYIGTGWNGTTYYKDFWEYDSATNAWTQKSDFGQISSSLSITGAERKGAVGFAIGTKGYIGTGQDGSGFKKDFLEYNPATNYWTVMANFGYTVSTTDTDGTARASAVGFSIGTKGYVGTGIDASGYTSDFWAYDQATDTWTKLAAFGGGNRASAVGLGLGTKGYIGTGWNGTTYYKDFWEYNPATNVWTKKNDFGGDARKDAVALYSFCGNGYVGLGMVPCSYFNDFWLYEPVTDTWIQKKEFGGGARASAVAFSIGADSQFVGTGSDANGTYYKDLWEYVPE
jgi:hypothetical protein